MDFAEASSLLDSADRGESQNEVEDGVFSTTVCWTNEGSVVGIGRFNDVSDHVVYVIQDGDVTEFSGEDADNLRNLGTLLESL